MTKQFLLGVCSVVIKEEFPRMACILGVFTTQAPNAQVWVFMLHFSIKFICKLQHLDFEKRIQRKEVC